MVKVPKGVFCLTSIGLPGMSTLNLPAADLNSLKSSPRPAAGSKSAAASEDTTHAILIAFPLESLVSVFPLGHPAPRVWPAAGGCKVEMDYRQAAPPRQAPAWDFQLQPVRTAARTSVPSPASHSGTRGNAALKGPGRS